MKHAIKILEDAMQSARAENADPRTAKKIAWDCLDAIQVLKLEVAARKAASKPAVKPESGPTS